MMARFLSSISDVRGSLLSAEAGERESDPLVCEVYGLTVEEIAIVEGETTSDGGNTR